ncbi:MAG TPA: hypothetical protein VGG42_07870, partial [Acidobacteriaceae bacterium]
LLEDISALQVTTTAAVHALLNKSLDPKEVRIVLYGVNTAARVLNLDFAQKRWLHQTGQTLPEPVVDFAVMGHEHVALEDPLWPDMSGQKSEPASTGDRGPATGDSPAHTPPPAKKPSTSLDPEDHFLTPETFVPFDEKMRIPLPSPGEPDPLRIDGQPWPCPYRFDYCQGPGPKASCHYCSGEMRWEDVHPNEPDPGAPGPLPTVDLNWTFVAHRDIAAPGAPSLSPSFGDRVGGHDPKPEPNPGAPSLSPSFGDRVGGHDPKPEPIDNPETRIPEPQSDPEPVAEEELLPVLVASAEELPPRATGHRLQATGCLQDVTNAPQQNQPLPCSEATLSPPSTQCRQPVSASLFPGKTSKAVKGHIERVDADRNGNQHFEDQNSDSVFVPGVMGGYLRSIAGCVHRWTLRV